MAYTPYIPTENISDLNLDLNR